MKIIQSYKLFESLNNYISIEEYLNMIGISEYKIPQILEWWYKNLSNIKIYYFPFSTQLPIIGVFLGTDEVAINKNMYIPPFMKLFILLHESRHCEQHKEGIFMKGYYDTVVNNNKEEFLKNYQILEQDANDFAINSMKMCGFEYEMEKEESHLRMNENGGYQVYNMMKNDIIKYNPIDFIDLLKKQIGL